ncbi:MAG: hypothetical protein ACI4PT_01420 [Candidatus Avoscillospira sp.]
MSALKPVQAVRTDLDIHLTGLSDLLNVQRLWADPAVMVFVGFPEGLHETLENLESNWLPWVQQVEATEGHVYLEISAPHTTKE